MASGQSGSSCPVEILIGFAVFMAACSEAERLSAVQVMEAMLAGCDDTAFGFHALFDAAFEEIRHTQLEAWSRASDKECRVLAPYLDLLTSLKLDRACVVCLEGGNSGSAPGRP